MLDFLVKTATYLDDTGNHVLANELDGLIDKLAQDTSGLIGRRGPLQREITPAYKESLESVLGKIVNMAYVQSTDPSPDAALSANQMHASINDAMPKDTELPALAKPFINQVLAALNELAANKDNVANPMQNKWSDVVNNGKAALEVLRAPTATKPTAKPKHKPNALVMKIQQDLGLTPNGNWTPETNDKFVALLSSNPEYAKWIEGGKFKGTLQQAAQFVMQLTTSAQMPEVKEAPKLQQPSWTSKHFQITPAAKQALNEIEKYWPGTSQKELNSLDAYKENGKMGKEMDQELFEEMLQGRARPA